METFIFLRKGLLFLALLLALAFTDSSAQCIKASPPNIIRPLAGYPVQVYLDRKEGSQHDHITTGGNGDEMMTIMEVMIFVDEMKAIKVIKE